MNTYFCGLFVVHVIQRSAKGQDVVDKVCQHLSVANNEKEYFACSFKDEKKTRVSKHLWPFCQQCFNTVGSVTNTILFPKSFVATRLRDELHLWLLWKIDHLTKEQQLFKWFFI